MWIKYPIIILALWCAAILQNSFLPRLALGGAAPNLVFAVFFVTLFFFCVNAEESPRIHFQEGLFLSLAAGFFLDVFSPFHFGPGIIAFLVVYLIVELSGYFLREQNPALLIMYFVILFFISMVCYQWTFYIISHPGRLTFTLNRSILIAAGYNLLVALLGFYAYPKRIKKQLALW
jgi:hypothetical protein